MVLVLDIKFYNEEAPYVLINIILLGGLNEYTRTIHFYQYIPPLSWMLS